MGDLIDRQAAIDMFQNMAYDDWNQGVSTSWADAFSECAEMIRDLPSAQPEVIRCKDCKYWDTTWQNDYAPNYHYCPLVDGTHRGDFYCADAERRGKQDG